VDLQFLEIEYDACDVLVNSKQFVSSAVFAAHTQIEPGVPYCERVVQEKGASILVFDLAGCLSALFAFATRDGSSAVLFADASGFTEAHRDTFRSLAERIGGGLSANRLGLSVRSALRLTAIPLGQLRPVPSLIRDRCLRKGLVALRFVRDDRSQFVVDIETIAFNAMGLP